ncbi:MAG TPA: hypothetical protein VFP37_01265 [Steroidobacteraceae bacterium]|nr:hypothetical protein [Steroidobacteraceae bacterium]
MSRARIGVVAVALGVLGLTWLAAGAGEVFFRAYLAAFLVGLDVSLGSLALLMMHELTGGAWGVALRPALIAAARLMPLHALLFLPLLLGLGRLYSWWPAYLAQDAADQGRAHWLVAGFFLARAALYFALWILLAMRLTRARSDARRRRASAWGLLVYAFTTWLASVDWIMSLAPRWYSSGFGFVIITAQALAALAFAVCVADKSADAAGRQTWLDIGNLLLTCVMMWMYVAFTQFLIIWAEDLPGEIVWYVPRVNTDWKVLTLAVVALQFAVPFALLLSRAVKAEPRRLRRVAAMVLGGHVLFAFYLVVPTLAPRGFTLDWTEPLTLAALLGIGAVFWLRQRDRMEGHGTPAPREP